MGIGMVVYNLVSFGTWWHPPVVRQASYCLLVTVLKSRMRCTRRGSKRPASVTLRAPVMLPACVQILNHRGFGTLTAYKLPIDVVLNNLCQAGSVPNRWWLNFRRPRTGKQFSHSYQKVSPNEDFINARAVLPIHRSILRRRQTVHYLPAPPAALKGPPSSRARLCCPHVTRQKEGGREAAGVDKDLRGTALVD